MTQEEFDTLPIDRVISERILPALRRQDAHDRWIQLMLDFTGGPRAHDREGFVLEEATNWQRAQILVAAGLSFNEGREYALRSGSAASRDFNARVLRKRPASDETLTNFIEGNGITGALRIPMITMHTTGDWQVPVDQQQVLRRAVDAAGKSELLVQRIVRAPEHCAFLDSEWEQGLQDLVAWVEGGHTPDGEDVLVDDLRALGGTFTRAPRLGSAEADAIDGADERVTVRGSMTLDGQPLEFAFVWAEIVDGGLRRLCAFGGPGPAGGRYERVLVSDREVGGCGAPGRRIRIAASTGRALYFSRQMAEWPAAGGSITLDVDFTATDNGRPEDDVTPIYGSVYGADGRRLPPGTKVEAYIGDTLCGTTALPPAVLVFQNPDTYDVLVAGPQAVPGCARDANITFRVNGEPVEQTAVNKLGGGIRLDLVVE